MSTTHVFIVNEETFPTHLSYLFVGTGAGNKNTHIPLLADISRVRKEDKIIFYVEKVGFFGVFQIDGHPFKDTSHPTYLEDILKKKLIYRVKIKPYNVYPSYVSEFDALDDLPPYTKDVQWSLIYRKLEGIRGCTPIFPQESDNLIKMIQEKNKREAFNNIKNFTYDKKNKVIKVDNRDCRYSGLISNPENSLYEMIRLNKQEKSFEANLQTYFTENIGRISKLELICGKGNDIEWIGNEVYCGVGLRKMDIVTITSDKRKNKMINHIELKSRPAIPDDTIQIKPHNRWIKSHIEEMTNSNIQPVLVTKKVNREYNRITGKLLKAKKERDKVVNSLTKYNDNNISLEVKWFEYYFIENDIVFEEVDY